MLLKDLDLNDTEKGRDPRTEPRGTHIERAGRRGASGTLRSSQ